jgi:predicted DNA repair protein MutK
LHHFAEEAAHLTAGVPGVGGVLAAITPTIVDALAGVVVGAIVLMVVTVVQRMRGKKAAH